MPTPAQIASAYSLRNLVLNNLPRLSGLIPASPLSIRGLAMLLQREFNLDSLNEAKRFKAIAEQMLDEQPGRIAAGIDVLSQVHGQVVTPGLVSPFGDYGRYKYRIGANIGEEWVTDFVWSDRQLSYFELLDEAIRIAHDMRGLYPEILEVMQELNGGISGFSVHVEVRY